MLQSFLVAILSGMLCNKAPPFAMHCPVLEGPDLLYGNKVRFNMWIKLVVQCHGGSPYADA